jgi:hypothetical protein
MKTSKAVHAEVSTRVTPMFDPNILNRSQSAEAALALAEVRSNAQVVHVVATDGEPVAPRPSWRTKVPKWVREGKDDAPALAQVSRDTLEQMQVWAVQQREFFDAHASEGDRVAAAMTDEERYLAAIDLTKQIGCVQVRLNLAAGLYDSPLLYTTKGLDPWVDKQCTRLRIKLFEMKRCYDPDKVMSAIYGFLWPFTQKGFKF